MITPAPTSKVQPGIARGTLEHVAQATATTPTHARIAFPNTSYLLYLLPTAQVTAEPGKRILGTVHARACRVDVVHTGGRYIDPLVGRPRRVQGTITAIDATSNTLTVDAAVPVHLQLTAPGQSASDFAVGQLVSCSVLDGATFTPVS